MRVHNVLFDIAKYARNAESAIARNGQSLKQHPCNGFVYYTDGRKKLIIAQKRRVFCF